MLRRYRHKQHTWCGTYGRWWCSLVVVCHQSLKHAFLLQNALRKDLDDLEGRVKQLGEKASNDFKDVTRRVQPTLQKLEKAYEEDLKKIYKEFADDKVLKDISQAL